ncbi:MAG: ABC-2 family transporter protein [Candidatus Lokiarchaeota archaeon]|nr:ABC-2 family transporter protein [Candidatus Lokiarchaeota archaeon]
MFKQYKKYLKITKNSILTVTTYRFHFFFSIISSILYFVIYFFLWRSIYDSSGSTIINGMTFPQVIVYISLAYSIFVLFKTWTEWGMSRNIVSGQIMMDLIKPYNYHHANLARSIGFVFFNFFCITIPIFILLFTVFNSTIIFGINLLYFAFSLCLAFLISFSIDYSIGLTSFYTESIWGISITKEVVIMALSGTLIPLSFFPDSIEFILKLLPFAAIYHIPISTLVTPTLGVLDYCIMFISQISWVIILLGFNKYFFKQAIKVVTINGG